ncbi:glycerophosphodiester phosphodiesterase [Streptococcus macacae]|uniref:Glycerophosphodiester phosphodiesterase family protein n=1 Tax=Streptococcus macacae NCTC 11558 TaxID=764298 RepID=G5JYQ7_9STRE|nr:glycerophosphodiester phosphodiesterase [Streptococcus macacae]EHJ52793.1 glycerophosphodiester phosphodiesterase family protein [Streptococcus macacae NCTC 11558]SUN78167.1 glycerophosphoryl diester phosphodiesterase [Streptococcus macacae NCTC 11558]
MTEIFAHRGSKINRPENTLAAFAEAIRVGSDGIEIDVHRTKDNHLIVIHDERVDRTTNGSGLVRKLTLQEIKELDAGSWFHPHYFREKIPTLEEVLDYLEEKGFRGRLNIELKTNKYPYPKIEKQIAQLMQSKKLHFSYLYSSFNIWSLYLMKKHDPKADLAYIIKDQFFLLCWAQRLKFVKSIHLKHSAVFKRKAVWSKELRFWAVNEEASLQKLLSDCASGIITDKPEEAVKLKNLLSKE